ncbi:MAG: Do/DeqQ family serine protease [Glaciecola sp.]|jgi:Do/DeqQ family serine protease
MKVLFRKLAVCITAGSIILVSATNASAALPFFSSKKGEVPSLAPMIELTSPAVVSISVQGTQAARQQTQVPEMFREFFGSPNEQVKERPFRGMGSGVIIDAKKGYVVTNNHVIQNADEITVKLTDGREFTAKKLGADEQSDVALLQIEASELAQVSLANSDQLRVGDFTVAIGNPFGLGQTVTSGIVSALGRSGLNIGGLEDFIQTDAAINRGNSGGALVNLNGELIGINTAIFGPNGGNVGIGFAIPSNMMKSIVDQIVEFGEVRRGLLGIQGRDVDAGLAEAMRSKSNKGAFIMEVVPDSAADKAGLKSGDIIFALNDKKLSSFDELRAKVASMGAGANVELSIVREGEEQNVNVVLGDAGMPLAQAKELHPAFEGSEMNNGKDQAGNDGVAVSDVQARSPAARIGLKSDDVIIGLNRQRVNNVADLRRLVEESEGNVMALNVKRGSSTIYVVIRQ